MPTDQEDIALGRYTRLTRQIKKERTELAKFADAFAKAIINGLANPADNHSVTSMDSAEWRAAFDRILAMKDAIEHLGYAANKQAKSCGEPEFRIVSVPAPVFAEPQA